MKQVWICRWLLLYAVRFKRLIRKLLIDCFIIGDFSGRYSHYKKRSARTTCEEQARKRRQRSENERSEETKKNGVCPLLVAPGATVSIISEHIGYNKECKTDYDITINTVWYTIRHKTIWEDNRHNAAYMQNWSLKGRSYITAEYRQQLQGERQAAFLKNTKSPTFLKGVWLV